MSDFDKQDLQQLNEQFTEFNRILRSGSVFGDNSDKIVTALGTLGAALTKNSKSKTQETKYVEEFKKKVEKSTDAVEDDTKATEEDTKATQRATKATDEYREAEKKRTEQVLEFTKLSKDEFYLKKEALKAINEESKTFRELREVTKSTSSAKWEAMKRDADVGDMLKDKFYDVAGGSMGAQLALRAMGAVAEGVTQSLSTFAKSLLDGKRGPEVTAAAFKELTNSVGSFMEVVGGIVSVASWLMPGGVIVKALGKVGSILLGGATVAAGKMVKATGEANERAATYTRKLFDTYNTLSKSGATLSNGVDGVAESMQRLGITSNEIENFTRLMGDKSQDLAVMSGFAAKGIKDFSAVAGTLTKSDLGKTLELMGVTAEDQREATLSYMTTQARLGKLNLKDTEATSRAVGAYVEEMELMTALSGASRKEQAAAQEAAMAEDRFRAAYAHATETGNKEKLIELDNAKKIHDILYLKGAKEEAKAALQYGAAGNATQIGIAGNMQYGFGQLIKGGAKNSLDIEQQLMNNLARTQKSYGGINAYQEGGKIGGIALTGAAKAQDMLTQKKTQAELAKEKGFTGPDAITKYAKFLQDEKKKPGETTENLVDGNRAQLAATQKMEAGIDKFNTSAVIHAAGSKEFANAVEKFSNVMGVDVAGGTSTFKGAAPTQSKGSNSSGPAYSTTGGGAATGGLRMGRTPGQAGGAAGTGGSGEGSGEQQGDVLDPDKLLMFNGGITGNRRNFDGLNDELKQKVLKAAVEYQKTTNRKMLFVSGARSREEQAKVKGQRGALAAAPGTSKHEIGMAVDVGTDPAAIEAMRKSGLDNTKVANEPWHFEKGRTGGLFSGPSSGYLIEAHDDEILLPAKDGVSKQALGSGSGALLGNNEAQDKVVAMLEIMADKYDTMITLLSDGNDHREKLVRSMA